MISKSRRRGLANVITYVLLLIAVIALTLYVIYNYLWPSSTSIVGSAKFIVENVHLGVGSFSITIKNIGQVDIGEVKAYVDNSLILEAVGDVKPGATLTCSIIENTVHSCTTSSGYIWLIDYEVPNVEPGHTYRITIVIYFANHVEETWTYTTVASLS